MRSTALAVMLLGAETCWIFAAWSVLAKLIGQSGVIMPLWVIAAIVYSAFALARASRRLAENFATSLQILLGAGAVYVAIASSPALYLEQSLLSNLVWPVTWISGGYSGKTLASIFLVSIGTTLAWRRGIADGSNALDQSRAMFVFKLGLCVITLATLVELGCRCNVRALPTGLAFLVTSLGALALERLAPNTQVTTRWASVFARAIASVVAFAALLGFIAGHFGASAFATLGHLWRTLVTAMISALTFLLTPVLSAIFAVLEWLRHRIAGGERTETSELVEPLQPIDWSKFPRPEAWGDGIVAVVELLLVAIFFLGLLKVLRQTRRHHFYRGWDDALIEREQMQHTDGSRLQFLRGLLGDLIPSWLKGVAADPDSAGSLRAGPLSALSLYFQTLEFAFMRGHCLNRSETPTERIEPLEAVLKGAPVAQITADFNEVCYGDRPPKTARTEALQAQLYDAQNSHEPTDASST